LIIDHFDLFQNGVNAQQRHQRIATATAATESARATRTTLVAATGTPWLGIGDAGDHEHGHKYRNGTDLQTSV
jgi:hypothetical protein